MSEILATPETQRAYIHKGKYQALRLTLTKEEINALSPSIDFTEDEQELVESHFEFLDVFFAYSTEVLQKVHERTGCTCRPPIRYGIRIACEGVPQGRMIDFDLTSNQGLSRQAHALISFKEMELDTGRKIPSNDVITEVVRKISVRAMSTLAELRWTMKKRDRPDRSLDIEGWRTATRERISESVVRLYFEKLHKRAPIQVDPDTEQDVIALFSVLLALDVLRGYELLALSGFNQYDGLINILDDESLRDPNDPFSIRASESRSGKMRVIEFKLQFESLLEDFENRKKIPGDIDLLVCWTLPTVNTGRGSIQYAHGDRNDFRQVYGMTHLWTDSNEITTIPIISLKHFVAERLKFLEAQSPAFGTAKYAELLHNDKEASI